MKIYESAEDYLEAILMLKKRLGSVRSIDIVNELGYSKPSVSVAMKKLRENNFITMDNNSFIELTPTGMDIATSIYARHEFISELLIYLGVTPKVAKEDACKIEHHLSDESFQKIRAYFIDKI